MQAVVFPTPGEPVNNNRILVISVKKNTLQMNFKTQTLDIK